MPLCPRSRGGRSSRARSTSSRTCSPTARGLSSLHAAAPVGRHRPAARAAGLPAAEVVARGRHPPRRRRPPQASQPAARVRRRGPPRSTRDQPRSTQARREARDNSDAGESDAYSPPEARLRPLSRPCSEMNAAVDNRGCITGDTIGLVWLRSTSENCAITVAMWSIVPRVESRSRSRARARPSLSCGRYRLVDCRRRLC
jgi:hypothetical protein